MSAQFVDSELHRLEIRQLKRLCELLKHYCAIAVQDNSPLRLIPYSFRQYHAFDIPPDGNQLRTIHSVINTLHTLFYYWALI